MKSLSGSLFSLDVLRELGGDPKARALAVRARSILTAAFAVIGPASGARAILDAEVLPLLALVGLDLSLARDASSDLAGILHRNGQPAALLIVGPWGRDLWHLWSTVSPAPLSDGRWALLVNGAILRIIDRTRIHSRRTLDVDLQQLEDDDDALASVLRLLDADAEGQLATIDRAAAHSDAHRSAVGQSLQAGVDQALAHLMAALGRRRHQPPSSLDRALADALTVVYRILFLLFAEARGLVPHWHPTYRRSYTIEALRPVIERSTRPPGVWQTLQAISRMAHRGCRAGTLRVTAFNGRLFAPAAAPLAESVTIDDRRIRDVLLAITTRASGDRRERISYADLGIEQLGSVYERVLDYAPAVVDGTPSLVRSGRRKATGTFYTPRSMTEYLVRRALAPLVRDRSANAILDLRVLDPAMGSGAFLVAACRYLADAYEHALVRDGIVTASEVGPAERAAFRRTIALRCLYGVDRNPTAVQLARLSLWLSTLAADRPLTFLDHHLRAGNSLVGAAPHDILRQPPGRRRSPHDPSHRALPLFDAIDLHARLSAVVPPRIAMANESDDTAEIVRRKERALAALEDASAPLAAWRALSDAWCAAWFGPSDDAGFGRIWGSLVAALSGQPSGLPDSVERAWLARLRELSDRERFFHWELEFPEVFFDAQGQALERPGFDAVIGNPPWDTLRGGFGETDEATGARALTRFSRDSGCYRLQGDGHANLYQLFTERALQLARPAGRLGLLLPSGLTVDRGCARLWKDLIENNRIDALLSFDNHDAVFPIHRGVRFILLTASTGGSTDHIQAVFGLRSPKRLEDVPDQGRIERSIRVPVALVATISGPDLALPELRSELDRRIVARIVAAAPALGGTDGWNCRFGRELNATDDRRHFAERGLPVLEGKSIEPFRVHVDLSKACILRPVAARILKTRPFDRPRLGYREVASATNRLTLIAAMIPAGVVTTHTIFCLKEALDADVQFFLCGIFNSFVANYLVRLRGSTHVTASMMAQLPVPKPSRTSADFHRVAAFARTLSAAPHDADAYAALQAHAARLYGLDAHELEHVVATFPLVDRERRDASHRAFLGLMDGI